MIRIGVDCRPLSRPVSGISRYTHELLRRMARRQDALWYFYSDAPLDMDVSRWSNASIRIFNERNRLAALHWYHGRLPGLMKRDSLDVFWSPRHHLPLRIPHAIRTVVTVHDMTWKCFPETMKPLQRWSERLQMPRSIRQADQIIAVSSSGREDILRYFPALAPRIEVIHSGATKLELEPLPRDVPDSFLLFVGTPEPRKNLRRLLAAYACLPACLKAAYPLVLAGGHGWMVDIGQLANDLGIADHVRVLGAVSGDELGYLYSRAKLLVLPSLHEGFGLPILEAFQFGVPAVTSDCSAMPEVAGKGAVLVNPFDVDSIRRGIESVLTEPAVYAACVAAIPRQLDRFDWDVAAEKTFNLLVGNKDSC